MTDTKLLAVIRAAVTAAIERVTPPDAAARAVHDAVVQHITAETPRERSRREADAARALMASGSTPMAAARRLAVDRHDPNEVTRLAQRFRRHRRSPQKNEHCASAPDPVE
jgi:hypothetical protein